MSNLIFLKDYKKQESNKPTFDSYLKKLRKEELMYEFNFIASKLNDNLSYDFLKKGMLVCKELKNRSYSDLDNERIEQDYLFLKEKLNDLNKYYS